MKTFQDTEQRPSISEVIGIPKRGIIFSDLDGVWFNESNNFAGPDPEDTDIIQEVKKAGFLTVLVSDTGATALANFAQEIGFDPVVIGENGAVVYLPKQGIREYLTDKKPFFDEFRERAIATLSDNAGSAVIIGDATALVRSDEFYFPPKSTVYIVNGSRECSFGVYTRVANDQGRLTVDKDATALTETQLKKLLEETQGVECKQYPDIGSCLIKDPTIKKWKAVQWVVDQFPSSLSYYMIGDTENDSMETIAERVVTCAVGNASAELKRIAGNTGGITAPDSLSIAKGANYVIRRILENEKNE